MAQKIKDDFFDSGFSCDGSLSVNGIAVYLRAEFGKEWIPVIDGLPEPNNRYLCINMESEKKFQFFARYETYEGGEWVVGLEVVKVTHWIPLPEPPKESKQNE